MADSLRTQRRPVSWATLPFEARLTTPPPNSPSDAQLREIMNALAQKRFVIWQDAPRNIQTVHSRPLYLTPDFTRRAYALNHKLYVHEQSSVSTTAACHNRRAVDRWLEIVPAPAK